MHGEANFLEDLLQQQFANKPSAKRILDAGCGTGRIGIELAKRGHQVTGVDLDDVMLQQARAKAPKLPWYQADLAEIRLAQTFDCIVMAGNVMIFVTPGSEAAVIANLARHLSPGGLLVAAFELTPPAWSQLTLARYDTFATAAGVTLLARWAGWNHEPWQAQSDYAVSVHRRTALASDAPNENPC